MHQHTGRLTDTDYDHVLGDGFSDVHMYSTMGQEGNGFSTILRPLMKHAIPMAGHALQTAVVGKLKGKSNSQILGDVATGALRDGIHAAIGGGFDDEEMDLDPGVDVRPAPRKRRRAPRVAKPLWAA